MPNDNGTTRLELDPQSLTLGETEEFEELTNVRITTILGGNVANVPIRAVIVLAWILMRRNNPELTLDDVRAMKWSEFDLVQPGKVEAAEAPATPSD